MSSLEVSDEPGETLFAVIVSFVVGANNFAQFSRMVRENARLTLANEVGCLRFDVLTSSRSHSRVVLYELYRSEGDFDAHLTMPHFIEFDVASAGMVTDKAVERFCCEVP